MCLCMWGDGGGYVLVYFFLTFAFFNNVTILASEELVVIGEHVLVFAVG